MDYPHGDYITGALPRCRSGGEAKMRCFGHLCCSWVLIFLKYLIISDIFDISDISYYYSGLVWYMLWRHIVLPSYFHEPFNPAISWGWRIFQAYPGTIFCPQEPFGRYCWCGKTCGSQLCWLRFPSGNLYNSLLLKIAILFVDLPIKKNRFPIANC